MLIKPRPEFAVTANRKKRVALVTCAALGMMALVLPAGSVAKTILPWSSGTAPQTLAALTVGSNATPATIISGGGGFEYSDTQNGYPTGCGDAAIGVNNVGSGKVQLQIEIDSNIGPMAGSAKVTYSGGNKTFDVSGTHYVSDVIEFGNFSAGESVGFVLSFNDVTIGSGSGSCGIPQPAVAFTY